MTRPVQNVVADEGLKKAADIRPTTYPNTGSWRS